MKSLIITMALLISSQQVFADFGDIRRAAERDRERERIEREIERRRPPAPRPPPAPAQPVLVKSFKVDKFIKNSEVIEAFDYYSMIRITCSEGKVEFSDGTPFLINRYGQQINAPRINRMSKGDVINWYPAGYDRYGRLVPEYVERVYLDMTTTNLTGSRGRITVEFFR